MAKAENTAKAAYARRLRQGALEGCSLIASTVF